MKNAIRTITEWWGTVPRRTRILAGIVAVPVLLFLPGAVYSASDGVSIFELFWFALITLFGLPIIIAVQRQHHQTTLVIVLTLLGVIPFLGWITWLLALLIAAATPSTSAPAHTVVVIREPERPL